MYLQLPNREWTLQQVAPRAIPTVLEYLKQWLVGNKDYVKNHSCELSQHSMNYIVLMSKYFSEMALLSPTSLAHIFHHLRMLKSITFPDSLMSVEGSEWMLKDPNMGCHSFRTNKGSICPLVDCRCLFSDSQQLCQHILKHYGHIWGCDKCQEYCSWDTGTAYDHWTLDDCEEWKGKLLLMEQEQEARKGKIVHSKAEFNWAAEEDPAHYCPFKAQYSVPLISAFATRDGKLCTLEDDEKVHAWKVLGDLFQKLQAEFPSLPPDSPMKILPKNKGGYESDEDQGDSMISVSNDGSEESGAK